jgi:hypothetical protein
VLDILDTMNPLSLPTDEAVALSAELSALSLRQHEALVKSPYLLMSTEEARGYDQRRRRIDEVCEALAKFRRR